MTHRALRLAVAGFGTLAILASMGASADSLKPGDERFKFVAGWFLPSFGTDVRFDSGTDVGDEVNLDDDLGIDRDESGVLLGFEWRFADRHRLGATWSSFSQNGERVFDEELTIGDETFPVDAVVRTDWSLDMIPITYSYSFINREKDELAGTFGIHFDSISIRLRAETTATGQVLDLQSDHSADLPLPLLGLRYDHNFSDSWSAGISASYFSIEFGESTVGGKGSLYNGRIYGEYRFKGRYGAGLAIDAFSLDLDANKNDFTGSYEYNYWGPQLYLTARF
jgi:uncharacterized protein YuzE